MIDTHAHVYRYVTGRFGLDADMVGVESGVTALIDQGGASCMTFPGYRHFVAEKAASRCYAFISAYLVGGLEGHYYPSLYSPDGIDVAATVAAAKANRDLVKGVKSHAEIGGFARWGTTVMEMASQIGRDADLPVYVHFGQLWALTSNAAQMAGVPDEIGALKPGMEADVSVLNDACMRLRRPRVLRRLTRYPSRQGRHRPFSSAIRRPQLRSTLWSGVRSSSRWIAPPSQPRR
jgi:predicted amidohydrolase